MPIVVDEVVISVDLSNQGPRAPGDPSTSGSQVEHREIVNECVERVLEILAEREER